MTAVELSGKMETIEPYKGARLDRPIRVLHVVGSMDRGGTETWLMHVLRHVDRDRFQMDFLVHAGRRCDYDGEIESLGGTLRVCRDPNRPYEFAADFLRVLQEHGPYDVVHSHMHHFSGFALRLAKIAGVRKRIAHSHNANCVDETTSSIRKAYIGLCGHWIRRCATFQLAASPLAAKSLFGSGWRADNRTQILYCGLDFTPFRQGIQAEDVRPDLDLRMDDFVVGHVGRFMEQKNHRFLLDVYEQILKRKPDAKLLLVGRGPLEDLIKRVAEERGILHGIRFAGVRGDVPRLLLGAMDVFVFPSVYEGLGLAAVEAQAAGLPTVVSHDLPAEVDLGCGLVQRVSLAESPQKWAGVVLQTTHQPRVSKEVAAMAAAHSRFDLAQNVEQLARLYAA